MEIQTFLVQVRVQYQMQDSELEEIKREAKERGVRVRKVMREHLCNYMLSLPEYPNSVTEGALESVGFFSVQ